MTSDIYRKPSVTEHLLPFVVLLELQEVLFHTILNTGSNYYITFITEGQSVHHANHWNQVRYTTQSS